MQSLKKCADEGTRTPTSKTLDPKSSSATNYDTSALKNLRKIIIFYKSNKTEFC